MFIFTYHSVFCGTIMALCFWGINLAEFVESGITSDKLTPIFVSKSQNISVSIGRDAMFTCHIKNIGIHKVGWVKFENRAIQTMHNQVITHNPRVHITGDFKTTFNLHITKVREEDRGQYMCQLNTKVVNSQINTLDVMIPPDIIESTQDPEVKVGKTAKLNCQATGYPQPNISWKREKDKEIRALDNNGKIKKYKRYHGASLTIPDVKPDDIGAYLCIANNDVPPSRSKRIVLHVNFEPKVKVRHRTRGLTLGRQTKLSCEIKGYPKPSITWYKLSSRNVYNNYSTPSLIVTSERYKVNNVDISDWIRISSLIIRNASPLDEGKYQCMAENSVGKSGKFIQTFMFATSLPTSRQTSSTSTSVKDFFKKNSDDKQPYIESLSFDDDEVNNDLHENNDPFVNDNSYQMFENNKNTNDKVHRRNLFNKSGLSKACSTFSYCSLIILLIISLILLV